MAIEKNVPKDLKSFEPKLIGQFTTRQVLLLAPAVALGCAVMFGLKSEIPSTDLRLTLTTVVILPFVLFAVIKPYGQPLEKFAKTFFIYNILFPAKRLYKTRREQDEDETPGKSKTRKSKRGKKSRDKSLTAYR